MNREARLQEMIAKHRSAADIFIARASAVAPDRWYVPRADGKWTPAQETQHVILSYEMFLNELVGAPGIRIRGTPWTRFLWRAIGLTQILWFDRIPVAANAARELRPPPIDTPLPELVARLRGLMEQFEQRFAETWRTHPRLRLTHYMFGRMPLTQVIQMMSVHTRHHAMFLPEPSAKA